MHITAVKHINTPEGITINPQTIIVDATCFTDNQSGEISTTGTLIPNVTNITSTLFNIDRISLLEINQPELFENKKILIVDDLSFALDRAQSIVKKRFRENNGCTVETVNDPEKAIEMIALAKAKGSPYDVLVTDLYMQRFLETGIQGINGDEFLRRLNTQGLFIPTVVFSGSWASDINQNLFSQLDQARSGQEIHSAVDRASNALNGIPLVQVDKTGVDTERNLFQSICGVILMGKRADVQAVHEFLAEYNPKALEDTPSREIISKAIEIHRLYKEFLIEVKKEFESQGLQTTYPYVLIGEVLGSKDEWSLSDLGEATSHRARVFFHNKLPVMQWIYEHTVVSNNIRERISRDTIDKLEDFYRAMNFYAVSTKTTDIASFNFNGMINDKINHLLRHLPYPLHITNELDGRVPVNASPYVIEEIIMQPLTNAFKAIRGQADGSVTMRIREVSKDNLKIDLAGERFIEVTIEDNGCGMTEDKVSAINEKRCREGESTFGTLGWGLPILQDFMGKVDGDYCVESTLGKGTKFTIYFKIPEIKE